MAGTTTNLGLTLPTGGDAPSLLRTSITNNANALDAYSLLTSTVTNVGSASVLRGQSVIASPSTTQTLPGASANAMVAITASSTVTAATPVTVAGSNIYGVGLSAVSSFTLGTAGACVVLQSDGANWFVVGGRQDTLAVSRGATNIATSQSTSSASFTTLATPDQVTGIVVPANGLIAISYQAIWQESVSGAAQAAIFIGSNQLVVQGFDSGATHGPLPQAAATGGLTANLTRPLYSWGSGLASGGSNSAYNADVTTGQAVGYMNSVAGGVAVIGAAAIASLGIGLPPGGPCEIFGLPAGTYTISVQFKASSGSVTASNRKLWVQALSFG